MAGRSNKQKTPEIGESSTRSLLSPPPTEARTRKQKASLDKPKLPELQEEQESPNEDSSSREESSDNLEDDTPLPATPLVVTPPENPLSPTQYRSLNKDMSSIINHALAKAMDIKPLQEPGNWHEWNNKLSAMLRMAGVWKILTDPGVKPVDAEKLIEYEELQERLSGLFQLIVEGAAESVLERLPPDSSATAQYKALAAEYDAHTAATYSRLVKQAFHTRSSDFNSISEYGNSIMEAKNKLARLVSQSVT